MVFRNGSKQGMLKKMYAKSAITLAIILNSLMFFILDGDLTNTRFSNLKTVCANCQRIMQKEGVKWKQGNLIPDF